MNKEITHEPKTTTLSDYDINLTPVRPIKTTPNDQPKVYNVNNSNINEYFDDNNEFINTNNIQEGSILNITGTYEDTNFFIDNFSLKLQGITGQTLLKGSLIHITGKPVTISNFTINNTDKDYDSSIILEAENCIVENCDIYHYTTDDVKEIYVTKDNNIIRNNNITVIGPSDEIDWYSNPDLARNLAIAICSNNNTVIGNNISTTTSVNKIPHGAVESITIQGASSTQRAENNSVIDNNIFTNSTGYSYGVNAGQFVDGTRVTNNNITTLGDIFADGIQIFTPVSYANITNNTVYCRGGTFADGIVLSKDKMGRNVLNNSITSNKVEVEGDLCNLIEIYESTNTLIADNIANGTGVNLTGITVNGKTAMILNNTINITSSNSSSNAILVTKSNNVTVKANTAYTNTDYSVGLFNSNNTSVVDNYLNATRSIGDSSVNDTRNVSNTIANNTPLDIINTTTIVQPINALLYDNITITVNVVDAMNNSVKEGKVFFKVNGITLKDAIGSNIYASVDDGVAKLDYMITKSCIRDDSYIQAVYLGTDHYNSSRSDNTPLNISYRSANVTIFSTDKYYKSGDSVTLTAFVTDNSRIVNGGRVIFKINGITIKDSNGNPLYANVVNGAGSINYVIPNGISARNYTITAVFANSVYNRATANKTLNIAKSDAFIDVVSVRTNTNKTVVNGSIYDQNNNLCLGLTSVAIKLNGITVGKATAVDGIFTTTINTAFKPNTYDLTFIAGENNRYNSATKTTILSKY